MRANSARSSNLLSQNSLVSITPLNSIQAVSPLSLGVLPKQSRNSRAAAQMKKIRVELQSIPENSRESETPVETSVNSTVL
jgi:hypothetical protein